jgi:hypothetical protein
MKLNRPHWVQNEVMNKKTLSIPPIYFHNHTIIQTLTFNSESLQTLNSCPYISSYTNHNLNAVNFGMINILCHVLTLYNE